MNRHTTTIVITPWWIWVLAAPVLIPIGLICGIVWAIAQLVRFWREQNGEPTQPR